MKKFLSRIWENVLFIETLFLLAFIPLYPKLPILDVKNTWVYIRAEDFIVFFAIISWVILFIKKKVSLKTPLTIPILLFWLIGGIATIHAILIIFPTIANVFPNVAFLSLLRHIEYLSLFFIAYFGVRTKKELLASIGVLVSTLITVSLYGFGQKYLSFPAFLTMNEEFAKGVPIHLSSLSRVPSTFAGHYDLAAYLVLIIPILISLSFGVKNLIIKLVFISSSFLGLILLFMTVSRVSFFVLFFALFVVLFFQKKKLVLFSIPIIIFAGLTIIGFQPTLLDRFKSTVSEVEVLVDAKTGDSLGHVKYVPKEYFKDKIVLQRRVRDKEELGRSITGADLGDGYSSDSAILKYKFIPEEVPLVKAVNISTGENLPQGTGYVNLYLSPVTKRLGNFFYEFPKDVSLPSSSAQFLIIHGDFIVKRASAYDLSFTTRFQGEWPRAIDAFRRNIIFGSGYGSVSLAVDNNYLRVLGEIGILGLISFLFIFISLAIYIKKVFPDIDSKLVKSFAIGFGAGVIGLGLNATLIDVFEASKIAFLLWILSGITLGVLSNYQTKEFNLFKEIKNVALSPYAVIIYLFTATWLLFSPMINNYFVGDDFTWLRWAASCSDHCNKPLQILHYFTDSNGFFFRPGTKIYFLLMYSAFWLNQVIYHLVSILLHFAVASVFFLILRKLFKENIIPFIASLLFLVLSGSLEGVYWISSTGYLFNAVFGLSGLLFYMTWKEKNNLVYFILSIISISLSLLFHEMGVVYPLLLLSSNFINSDWNKTLKSLKRDIHSFTLFIPLISYLIIRIFSNSHWLNGDYSYDLIKLPFNFIGNSLGYLGLSLLGPISTPFYHLLREVSRTNILIMILLVPLFLGLIFIFKKFIFKKFSDSEQKIIFFGLSFFVITLLPFLGLGNITSRYSYTGSLGIIIIVAVLIKKAYGYLESSGRGIAFGVLGVALIVFSLFHIIQIQQITFDWRDSGRLAKDFFISFESEYSNGWSGKDIKFHFVNVPLRVGDAWVFPVGLPDAVWFAIRNENARIFMHNDLKSALNSGSSKNDVILRFKDDGGVEEIDKGSIIN